MFISGIDQWSWNIMKNEYLTRTQVMLTPSEVPLQSFHLLCGRGTDENRVISLGISIQKAIQRGCLIFTGYIIGDI